jgi:hypothetical protein
MLKMLEKKGVGLEKIDLFGRSLIDITTRLGKVEMGKVHHLFLNFINLFYLNFSQTYSGLIKESKD